MHQLILCYCYIWRATWRYARVMCHVSCLYKVPRIIMNPLYWVTAVRKEFCGTKRIISYRCFECYRFEIKSRFEIFAGTKNPITWLGPEVRKEVTPTLYEKCRHRKPILKPHIKTAFWPGKRLSKLYEICRRSKNTRNLTSENWKPSPSITLHHCAMCNHTSSCRFHLSMLPGS